ncbi:hypothetical protein KC19_12G042500 [Ceratodon purpureus]|uniref:Uncharacterized protein n=1 Tax=Ceratodon purpureus TaxID=3225 RepID=A0A8T0G3N4_CERPU|nr:hypothetical protein KC19_12G042500 [Ceratodon purpureus]
MQMAAAFVGSAATRHGPLCAARSGIQGTKLECVEMVSSVGVSTSVDDGAWRPGLVWAASKQKKKGKASRKSGGGRSAHDWSFDALMLVWDEVFDRCCEDSGRAGVIRALGRKGLERFGSGCVLVQETVRTLPRGSASGFSNHARSSTKSLDEPPAYETLTWTAEYVPRTFVFDPSLAPEAAGVMDGSEEAPVLDVTNQVLEDVPLVSREVLFSVLRGMDRTRIVGLTGDELSSVAIENGPIEPPAPDAGGEAPYNPRNEELVLMLVVKVDGQPAVGADVVKALPNTADPENGQPQLWKLEMRDFHSLPI